VICVFPSVTLVLGCDAMRVWTGLEGRIHQLCKRLVQAAQAGEDIGAIAVELRATITEHLARLRANALEYSPPSSTFENQMESF